MHPAVTIKELTDFPAALLRGGTHIDGEKTVVYATDIWIALCYNAIETMTPAGGYAISTTMKGKKMIDAGRDRVYIKRTFLFCRFDRTAEVPYDKKERMSANRKNFP